jgi:hypothetical protein
MDKIRGLTRASVRTDKHKQRPRADELCDLTPRIEGLRAPFVCQRDVRVTDFSILLVVYVSFTFAVSK